MKLRIAMIKQVAAFLLVPLLVFSMARSPALSQVPPAAPDDQAWPGGDRFGGGGFGGGDRFGGGFGGFRGGGFRR
jgi:uncharacterized membrane protein